MKVTKKTRLLAKPLPIVTGVQQEGRPANTVYPNELTIMSGENLLGATVTLLGKLGDDTPVEAEAEIISTAENEVSLTIDYTTAGLGPRDFRFKVTTDVGTVEFPIIWQE